MGASLSTPDFVLPVVPDKCEHCSKPLTKTLLCASCRASGYCSKECQRAQWSAHKFGCSPLPVPLGLAFVESSLELCKLDTLTGELVGDTIASWKRSGAIGGNPGWAITQAEQLAHSNWVTHQFKDLASLRIPPKFAYPKYGGHKPTDPYTFTHHLVQIIRITFLHLFSDMTTPGKNDLFASFNEALPLLAASPSAASSTSGVTLCPAKLMSAPGGLSRDEYLLLPELMARSKSVVLVARSKHGVEWAQLVVLVREVKKNAFLGEYDCAQK